MTDSISGETVHLHFSWLGFTLAFPDQDAPAREGHDEGFDGFVLIRAVEQATPNTPCNGASDRLPIPIERGVVQRRAIAPQALSNTSAPVTTTPLCDSARLERSGVQLA